MKTRLLPDLDIARISPMPRDQKRRALQKMKIGRPPYTYAPVRNSALDIWNVEPGPLGAGAKTPWKIIEADIRKAANTVAESDANLRVGEALHAFAEFHHAKGTRQEIPSLLLGAGVTQKISYWFPAVVSLSGIGTIPFIDPRRSPRLASEGRRFVFSVMRHRMEDFPDLARYRLGIIQFDASADGARLARLFTDEGLELFDLETLSAIVKETLDIWREVLEEREEDLRRRAGSVKGSLI